jgi:hypothetical protein
MFDIRTGLIGGGSTPSGWRMVSVRRVAGPSAELGKAGAQLLIMRSLLSWLQPTDRLVAHVEIASDVCVRLAGFTAFDGFSSLMRS